MNQAQTNKNIDSQMFINCSFDIDYLEVTKIEPLKRYEENLFLLGKIFSNEINDNSVKSIPMDIESNQDIMNIDSKDINIQNKIEKIINSNDKKLDKEEIQEIINSLEQENLSDIEKVILSQLINSMDEYKETEEIIKDNKEALMKNKHSFQNLVTKIKNAKNTNEDFKKIKHEVEDQGYLTEYNKHQFSNISDNKNDQKKTSEEIFHTDNIILTSI